MKESDAKLPPALGFLTVVENPQLGLLGGYLVLNLRGRPLEFHCTTPVKPNRAQQILYGPTLEPYLYGEQIGQTLVAKASIKPLAVCTDLPAVLALRQHVPLPVALVKSQSAAGSGQQAAGSGQQAEEEVSGEDPSGSCQRPMLRLDRPHANWSPSLAWFRLGDNELAVEAMFGQDRQAIVEQLAAAESLDLSEPFGRIRDAIEEAQRGGR